MDAKHASGDGAQAQSQLQHEDTGLQTASQQLERTPEKKC